jgi:hypothetical protein
MSDTKSKYKPRGVTKTGNVQKTWAFPQKVLDNIEAIKLLTGDTTSMGVITHAVAAYLYGLTQHIVDVTIHTEDSLKGSAILNNIPTPISDVDYWEKITGDK